MSYRKIALVTGANKGIGFQIAKDLAADGFTVLLGARDLAKANESAKDIEGHTHVIQLDVTDPASIVAATARITEEFGRLDALVNNAGISHAGTPGTPLDEVGRTGLLTVAPMKEIRAVWETNVFGVIAITQAMLPLLRKAEAANIVVVGSSGGSMTWNSDPDNPHRKMFGAYSTSKAAVHAAALAFAFALEDEGIKVNIVSPGFTSTALNNFQGTDSLEDGTTGLYKLATAGSDGPTGTFTGPNGRQIPW